MKNKLFGEKLAHYASKEPKHFLQMDGYYDSEVYDELMHPDLEGDAFIAQGTVELMDGATVRILIPYHTDPTVAARQIKKMAKWLRKKPSLIDFAKPEPEKAPPCDSDFPF